MNWGGTILSYWSAPQSRIVNLIESKICTCRSARAHVGLLPYYLQQPRRWRCWCRWRRRRPAGPPQRAERAPPAQPPPPMHMRWVRRCCRPCSGKRSWWRCEGGSTTVFVVRGCCACAPGIVLVPGPYRSDRTCWKIHARPPTPAGVRAAAGAHACSVAAGPAGGVTVQCPGVSVVSWGSSSHGRTHRYAAREMQQGTC